MPMVKEMLESMSGKSIKYEVNPDTAVAIGAAILANTLPLDGEEHKPSGGADDALSNIKISDVTSQSLGVITLDAQTNKKINSIIIPHNTKIPSKKSGHFTTIADNQTSVLVEVTEGNDEELEYVKVIGGSTLTLPAYPKGSPIEVIYQYDIDQTVFIEVIDGVTNESLGTFEIDRVSNLSKDELARAVTAVRTVNVE
jgi:molecular chaperone DnaK